MAKYDVFVDPRGTGQLLMVVQHDLFEKLDTRLAIPLLPLHPKRTPLKKLNPVFTIAGGKYALYPQHMLAVPKPVLKQPIANLREKQDDITKAVDMLFQGF